MYTAIINKYVCCISREGCVYILSFVYRPEYYGDYKTENHDHVFVELRISEHFVTSDFTPSDMCHCARSHVYV